MEANLLKKAQSDKCTKKICIIIPTYNEKLNLQILIPQICTALNSLKLEIFSTVLIVDDNSPNGTGKLAENLAQIYENVRVLHRPTKFGIGSAYRQGFSYALQRLDSDIIFQMDADLSHDPTSIPNFLAKLEEDYDAVIGSRKVPGGAVIGWSFYRRLMSSIANKLSRWLCGIKIFDATSGYRAFTSKTLKKIEYSSVKSNGYAFQIEILFRCQREGFSIAEIPIVFTDRSLEKTKLNKMEVFRFMLTCLKLFFRKYFI